MKWRCLLAAEWSLRLSKNQPRNTAKGGYLETKLLSLPLPINTEEIALPRPPQEQPQPSLFGAGVADRNKRLKHKRRAEVRV